jgi:hypothetical protein
MLLPVYLLRFCLLTTLARGFHNFDFGVYDGKPGGSHAAILAVTVLVPH